MDYVVLVFKVSDMLMPQTRARDCFATQLAAKDETKHLVPLLKSIPNTCRQGARAGIGEATTRASIFDFGDANVYADADADATGTSTKVEGKPTDDGLTNVSSRSGNEFNPADEERDQEHFSHGTTAHQESDHSLVEASFQQCAGDGTVSRQQHMVQRNGVDEEDDEEGEEGEEAIDLMDISHEVGHECLSVCTMRALSIVLAPLCL